MNNHPKVAFPSHFVSQTLNENKNNEKKISKPLPRTGRSPAGSRPGHHTAARRRNTAGGWPTMRMRTTTTGPVGAGTTAAEDACLTHSPGSQRAGTVLGL